MVWAIQARVALVKFQQIIFRWRRIVEQDERCRDETGVTDKGGAMQKDEWLSTNQIKSNQITFIVTSPQHKCLGEWNSYERAPDSAKKQQQTIYLWTDSAKKQQTIYLWTDSAKKQQTIYLWTDSAKKQQTIYLWTDSAKKQQTIYLWTDSAKKQQTIYLWTDSAKKQQTIYIWTDSAKKQQQFTYGQTVQKKQQQFYKALWERDNMVETDSVSFFMLR